MNKVSKCVDKKCESAKICNPPSGRCVLKSGKIGISLLKSNKKIRSLRQSLDSDSESESDSDNESVPDISNREYRLMVDKYGKSVIKFIDKLKSISGKKYKLVKLIGKGRYGTVYLICADKYDCKIIKVQKIKKDNIDMFKHELLMQKKFSNLGLAPKIYSYTIIKRAKDSIGIIEMEKIDGVLDSLLKNKLPDEVLDSVIIWITDLIDELCNNNLIHGDLHFGNIGYSLVVLPGDKIGIKIYCIDQGWSCCRKDIECIPQLELLQFIRCISLSKMNKYNQDYLFEKSYDLYKRLYRPISSKAKTKKEIIEKISDKWDKLFTKYEKVFDRDLE